MAKTKDSLVRLDVAGRECEIDLEDLTLGELEEAEVYFDRGIGEIDFGTARGTLFLAYLARRRAEPSWTLDMTRRLKPEEVKELKATRPTKGGSKPGSSGDPS